MTPLTHSPKRITKLRPLVYFQNHPAYVPDKFYHKMCFTQLHRTLHHVSRGSTSAHMMQSSVQKSVCGQIQNLDDFGNVHLIQQTFPLLMT